MTLRHMKIFTEVFQLGSVTRAAESLHLSQPSLSVAIQELEEHYAVKLFERLGRRLSPTEAGKELYSYALHIISLFDEAGTAMRELSENGSIRLCATAMIGTYILPEIIHRFQLLPYKSQIEVSVCRASQVEMELLRNTADLGLMEAQPKSADLVAVPFLQDELCGVVSTNSSLAGQKAISLAELKKYPLLLREHGSSSRDILDAAFSLQQIHIKPLWQSTSTRALVHAAAEGFGVAVLPYKMVERDIREGIVSSFTLDEPLQRKLNVVYHKNKYLTPRMAELISLCKTFR